MIVYVLYAGPFKHIVSFHRHKGYLLRSSSMQSRFARIRAVNYNAEEAITAATATARGILFSADDERQSTPYAKDSVDGAVQPGREFPR